jgi:NO-binding membrane sensor protein with MHYT domain/two-component sensor histidine kinase
MVGTYDGWLVALSVVVAVVASYVALDLASRIAAWQGRPAVRSWVVGAAIAMGTGIWSMHYIGMFAYRLPIPMWYSLPVTLLSMLIAIVVSGLAFYLVIRHTLSVARLIGGGVVMGIGIAAMHYTGMAAMEIEPPIRYQPMLVAASIVIAVAASIAALWSAFVLRLHTLLSAFWKKTGGALVMGTAISGMHYTGMAAAIIAPNSVCTVPGAAISNSWLAFTVGGFSLLFEAMLLLIASFDALLAGRSIKHAEESEARLRQALEERERFSRDLHDGIVQGMYATGLGLEEARRLVGHDDATAKERLTTAIERMNSIIRDVRRQIIGSTQAEMSAGELRRELEALIGSLRGTRPLHFSLDVDPAALAYLSGEATRDILNIVREAVSNTLRHSRAKSGRISLLCHDHGVRLTVQDDGIGFNPQQARAHGQGLRNIATRAERLGARLDIRSSPGQGTRIDVDIPARERPAGVATVNRS